MGDSADLPRRGLGDFLLLVRSIVFEEFFSLARSIDLEDFFDVLKEMMSFWRQAYLFQQMYFLELMSFPVVSTQPVVL